MNPTARKPTLPQFWINRLVNFRGYMQGIYVLFAQLTLDNWNLVMWDCREEGPQGCTNDAEMNDCGNGGAAAAFFLSFFYIGSYIFTNLIVSIILDSFSFCFGGFDPMLEDEAILQLRRLWNTYDIAVDTVIQRWKWVHFMRDLYCLDNQFGRCQEKFTSMYLVCLYRAATLTTGEQVRTLTTTLNLMWGLNLLGVPCFELLEIRCNSSRTLLPLSMPDAP